MYQQQTIPKISFVMLLALTGGNFLSQPAVSSSPQSINLLANQQTSDTGLPSDLNDEDGSLSASSCGRSEERLTALVPQSGLGVTTLNQPTFLIYVPYGAEKIRTGEFSIFEGRNEAKEIYRARFTVSQTPGIVSVQLPTTVELQAGTLYRWYFDLYCQHEQDIEEQASPSSQINAWIERIEGTPATDQQTSAADPSIWYDSLVYALEQIGRSNDITTREGWQRLLRGIERESLADKPYVGHVQWVESE